jgi:hypothetical protein
MPELSRRTGLVVLGIASASVVASEVLLTRLLSVCAWYGLAFLVLSLAMLGTTSGALAASRARGTPLAPWVARRLLGLSLGLVVAVLLVCSVPLVFVADMTAMASVLVVVVAATVPMAAGGGVVARLMAELPVAVGRAYAVDLVCAALGALAPLVLLGPLSGPSALVAVAAVAAVTAHAISESKWAARGALSLCVALIALTELSSHGVVVRYPKGRLRPDQPSLYTAWNPLSYVTLSGFGSLPFPLWSPGTTFQPKPTPVAVAAIDGEAGTLVYAYGRLPQLDSLELDGTAIAHTLRPSGTACVMGTGGGRDLETALLFGHDHVYGFEINPSMVAMLDQVKSYSPILDDPRVTVTLGDARAELARSSVKCRVLQASLVDTWAATSAGAFAHSESTLYTLEAWSLFLRRVEPDGVLTFSRWYEPKTPTETARLVALAVGALLERGAAHPRDHVALVAAGLVSPSPFTSADVATLREAVTARGQSLLLVPGEPAKDPLLDRLLDARDFDALAAAGIPARLDTSVPTDERPFFFQLLAPRAWLHPVETLRAYEGDTSGTLAGNVAAAVELVIAGLASVLVALVLLGPTLLRAARAKDAPLPGRAATAYFASLGAGFMLAEVALVQRLHVVLGHPTYALIVVLAGLLVATGIGSALSARVVRSRRAVSVAGLVAAATLVAMPWLVIRPLAHATMEAPFGVRVAWCGGCAAVIGLVLGVMFPSGIAYTDRERAAPVALALGGASSVVAGSLAVVVSVGFGIPAAFAAAGFFYVVAAACGPARWTAGIGGG